ncbi:MAG: helix-turn-helix domain-containing protein [Candidatus Cloacimonetes bacterium]|nr:helix-turn-helix domain-containing protein [Candidatus Cloacimonadota bacterium]MDY0367566.1 helix-turn-helix domain-containing protein [Candidatus Syntrophosphaera sp.]
MELFKSDRCYRPDEIATILGVVISTVYRMMRDIEDPLPSYRIAGKRQLRAQGKDLNAYMERHRVCPENE